MSYLQSVLAKVDAHVTLSYPEAVVYFRHRRALTKKDFAAFITYYNGHKEEFGLSEEQVNALKELRIRWGAIKKAQPVDVMYMFGMKEFHTLVNGHLLGHPMWDKYLHDFQYWRCFIMATSARFMTPLF